MALFFDHLVIAARTLKEGNKWVNLHTGVTVPPGGKHILMATHNNVMALGSQSYLEVIAADPDVSPPERPRWMGLDDSHIIRQLEKSPRLLTWVVRTSNLNRSIAGAKETGIDPGVPLAMSRGALNWQIAVRNDGGLLEKGLLPILIEWPEVKVSNSGMSDQPSEPIVPTSQDSAFQHPAEAMADPGLRLIRFELFHPDPIVIKSYLFSIGFESLPGFLEFHEAPHRLVAHFVDRQGIAHILDSSD